MDGCGFVAGGAAALRRPSVGRNVCARRGTQTRMIFGGAAKKPESQSPGSNPYRLLGITEDAEFEEVEAAYRRLCAKYAQDPKMLIKLEMNKEAIMEDRLQKRMKGLMTPKVKESPFERKPKKKKLFVVPRFLRGIVRLPDRAHFKRVSTLLGVFTLMPFFLPTLSSSFMAISGMSSMGFLYNRGAPEEPKDDMGRPGAIRPVEKNLVLKTIALVCVFGGLGFGLAKLICSYIALPVWLAADTVISTCVIFGFWTSSVLFQVQPYTPSIKKKGKGWGKPDKGKGKGKPKK
mmetsp:Transcript_7047/g.21487  ORF Transcript_7047/g.21487 Transcript_7047/m.21487 type:complete len:290 (+) Transcript_7047:100-969(+)